MPLTAGIVGLPNVGKSTIFNALTAAGADAANYPFCTIEPNTGIVPVPDGRLDVIARHIATERVVPASLELVDIAGLVRGASTGEGLGNRFLGHIRNVDAIVHVLRCFEDDDVLHVDGTVDPVRDAEIVNLELILADLESAERQLEKNERAAMAKDTESERRMAVLSPIVEALRAGRPARRAALHFTRDQRRLARELGFLTIKPVLYVANVDEANPTGEGNPHVAALAAWMEEHLGEMIVLSGGIEAEIAALDSEEERRAFLDELGLEESGLARLARAIYHLLGLHSFFTVGPKEIHAWPVRIGTPAPRAAGQVHTDMERGFIRAERYRLDDLVTHGSEAAIRAAGKMRSEGKDYIVQDGDILRFLFNV